jgi:hypothetical protein
MVARGYDPGVVYRMAHLVKDAEFKGKQAPLGIKVTDRAFGTGWRMPLAAREGDLAGREIIEIPPFKDFYRAISLHFWKGD